MTLAETILRKWLTIPYPLHTTVQRSALKKAPTVLFLHGIGNSGEAWHDVIEKLPKEYHIITIDLLGFGKSPKPSWMTYDARQQARAVMATYLRLRVRGRVVIVGHSLGALVAVEIARRYPLLVRSLVLCSPPFYKIDETKRRLLPSSDQLLQDMYRLASKHPEQFVKISAMAVKLGITNKSFSLTRDSAAVYMNALEATVINQTSLKDAAKLAVPVRILHGRFDPVVVLKNLRFLANTNPQVTVKSILASHEVTGLYVDAVVKEIIETIGKK
ncbi:MAG TPA: alpha/beta hydrolase [Candidatus Saccharimonadales bacterium]|nr:alpha/beta hydrolase [Candidatus Saccharimonadales bacterium]